VSELKWSGEAVSDLARIHDFLAEVNPEAAARRVRALVDAPRRLQAYPRLGERLPEFKEREMRRLFVRHYELRYEVRGTTIYVLRI